MESKWKIFLLTFLSYALIHAVRTSWSSLKYTLNSPPYTFSPLFLGMLDMIVLLILAVSLNIFGPKVVSLGPKKYLEMGMIGLCIVMVILAFFLLFRVTASLPYAIVYAFVGFLSCVGWPSCLYILSLHFEKGLAFSFWNGCTQFGDFAALILSFIFIQQIDTNPGVFLFAMTIITLIVVYLNRKYLPEQRGSEQRPLPQASPAQKNIQDLVQQKEEYLPQISNDNMGGQNVANQKQKVNFLTVWTLPGVSGYILSYAFIKSVNSMISSWLVFYLSMIDMVKESQIIALLWSISTFLGGILGAYLNPKFTKKYFIITLIISSIFFVFLEQMHVYPNQVQMIILVISCGISFGGSLTLIGTSIPLYLSQKPAIKYHPGAKAAIISAMEGYPLLFCGVSLLIVPAIGVVDLHWVACIYCIISASILMWEEYREQRTRIQKEIVIKRALTQPAGRSARDMPHELSANLQHVKDAKKKKRARRSIKSAHIMEKQVNEQKQSENKEVKSDISGSIKEEIVSLPSDISKSIKDQSIALQNDTKQIQEEVNADNLQMSLKQQKKLEFQQQFNKIPTQSLNQMLYKETT